ncbi:MAG: ATP synthase F1 subunit epsilon [Patescibacteria group bacterium]|nr:ATP synthase F1 subunit epsilon [Patescibacteria group bacterium]
MNKLKLTIITPKKIVYEKEVNSITAPAEDGEITVLPRHINLFTLLREGIIKIKIDNEEEYFSIGAGYLETDGQEATIIVSQAYGQEELSEKMIEEAIQRAKNILSQATDEKTRQEALAAMRRALIDSKLLKRRKKTVQA